MSVPEKKGRKTPPVLARGVLKTSGKPYSVHILDADWIDDVHRLHNHVEATLSPGQKTYLHAHEREFFEAHVTKGGMVLGILCEGELIAKSLIAEPERGKTKIQSNTVHPDHQNNGLTQHLIRTWITVAVLQGHAHLEAEVDIRNTASLKTLINNGLEVTQSRIDPHDGGSNYVLQAGVKPAAIKAIFNRAAAREVTAEENLTDHDRIAQRLDSGYVGVRVERGRMLFAPKMQPGGGK